MDKNSLFTCHYVFFLLSHCAADNIGAPERISRKRAENLHNLLLVDDAAVCDA